MMTIKRIKFEDIPKSKGGTKKEDIDSLSQADIKKGILVDPDTPNLSDEDLKEFKKPKRRLDNEES